MSFPPILIEGYRVDLAIQTTPVELVVERKEVTLEIGAGRGPMGSQGDPGGNVMSIGLFSAISSLNIPVGTDIVQTSGHSTRGVGPARYVETATTGATAFRAQSANGRWFELAEPEPYAEQLGLVSGTVSGAIAIQNATRLNAGIAWLNAAGGGVIRFVPKVYTFGASIIWKSAVQLRGSGWNFRTGLGTKLIRNGDFVLLNAAGVSILTDPTLATATLNIAASGMCVDGGSQSYTTTVADFSAVKLSIFEDIQFRWSGGRLALLREMFDSVFIYCRFDLAGSLDGSLASLDLTSGSGWEQTNNIRFFHCTLEANRGRAINITGDASYKTNAIEFIGCKAEINQTNVTPIVVDNCLGLRLDILAAVKGTAGQTIPEIVKVSDSVAVHGTLLLARNGTIGSNAAALTRLVTLNTVVGGDLDIYALAGCGDITEANAVSSTGGADITVRVRFASNPNKKDVGSYGLDVGRARFSRHGEPIARFQNRNVTDGSYFDVGRVTATGGAGAFRLIAGSTALSEVEVFTVDPAGKMSFSLGAFPEFQEAPRLQRGVILNPRTTVPTTEIGAIWHDGRVSMFRFQHDNIAVQEARGFKWTTGVPIVGTWLRGDIVYNLNAAIGQPMGWMCVEAGEPGVWAKMPNLAAA